jgi:hypothetical protein
MTLSPVDTDAQPSIGSELERARLEHRARRIERALLVLRDHRARVLVSGRAPSALDRAIAGFGEELGAVRASIRRLP